MGLSKRLTPALLPLFPVALGAGTGNRSLHDCVMVRTRVGSPLFLLRASELSPCLYVMEQPESAWISRDFAQKCPFCPLCSASHSCAHNTAVQWQVTVAVWVTEELCHVCEGFGSAESQGRLVLLLEVKDTWCQCSLLGRAQDLGSPLPSVAPVCEPRQHPRKGPLSPRVLPVAGVRRAQ